MCLQGVLEGNPVLLKKTGQVVTPANGFNVIATANTKGRGSDDGRFTAASIIDDAFLERFVCTIDQEFPSATIEKKIVMAHMSKFGLEDEEFANKLIAWSNVIRKTFEADGVDEVVSTRRLCHIVKSHSIFNDRMKSIQMCINRFDDETRIAFLDLYTKIDESQLDEDGNTIESNEDTMEACINNAEERPF
jgi:MoxR-like ATPase